MTVCVHFFKFSESLERSRITSILRKRTTPLIFKEDMFRACYNHHQLWVKLHRIWIYNRGKTHFRQTVLSYKFNSSTLISLLAQLILILIALRIHQTLSARQVACLALVSLKSIWENETTKYVYSRKPLKKEIFQHVSKFCWNSYLKLNCVR